MNLSKGNRESQQLLFPVHLDLSPSDFSVLEEIKDNLENSLDISNLIK